MTTLVFEDLSNGTQRVVAVGRVFIAGFTGRDADAVAAHLRELKDEGVPTPDRTPTFYPLPPESVSQTPVVVTTGARTSGEVEPVIVVSGGSRYLTIGSDHTDREVETRDIAASKAACTKVVGTTCVELVGIDDATWDSVRIRSWLEGGRPYQDGTLVELMRPEDLLGQLSDAGWELVDGDVLFLGTVPTQGGLRTSPSFEAAIEIPGMRHRLELEYRTIDPTTADRQAIAKPEIEFTPAEDEPWVSVTSIDGQFERILASDPTTGTATRMLRFEPGCDTSASGVLRHDFWEEVYILSGELHDLTLDRVFAAGTYACRPPGMPHGPWRSEPGCLTFEVRYPVT